MLKNNKNVKYQTIKWDKMEQLKARKVKFVTKNVLRFIHQKTASLKIQFFIA